MSKGPGRWQREILRAVAINGRDGFSLKELLPAGTDTRSSAYRSLNRAAWTLARAGKVEPPTSRRETWRLPPEAGNYPLRPEVVLGDWDEGQVIAYDILNQIDVIRTHHPADVWLRRRLAVLEEDIKKLAWGPEED